MLKRPFILVAACALAAVPSSALAAWSRGFVVDYYSNPGWQDGKTDVNCPNGTLAPPNWAQVLKTPWRSEEDVRKLTVDGGVGFSTPLADRGPKPGQNIYRDPTLLPDPHMPGVVGNIGHGFDLDGDPQTGFVSPDGARKGLDNQIYRALGCHEYARGGGRGAAGRSLEVYDAGEIRMGAYTVLVVLSGDGDDPRNEPNGRVGIYLSKERLTIDGEGTVLRDYSYRIDPDPRFTTVFEAVSRDGVFTPKTPLERMHVRENQTRTNFPADLILEKPKIAVTLLPDDMVRAEFGGYRDWRYFYSGHAAGTVPGEIAYKLDPTALWYTLERHADWKPPSQPGPNTHISSAFVLEGVRAFVITPDSHQLVTRAEVFTGPSFMASETPQLLAARMRVIGADAGWRLEGGAAAWPDKPIVDPGPRDNLAWATKLTDGGGLENVKVQKAEIPTESRPQASIGR